MIHMYTWEIKKKVLSCQKAKKIIKNILLQKKKMTACFQYDMDT